MASYIQRCPHCRIADRHSGALVFEEVTCPHCSRSYQLMPDPRAESTAAKRFPMGWFLLIWVVGTFLAVSGMIYYVLANFRMGC